MLKQLKKRILSYLFFGVCFFAGLFLTTCGIEENYYLPQVPQTYIQSDLYTASINLPPLTSYYYAQNYKIYYRIYISDFLTPSFDVSILSNISPTLASNFTVIFPSTDPTSTSMGIPAGTLFNNCNYFELKLDGIDINYLLSTSGGNIRINFPTEQSGYPVMSLNNGAVFRLFRSSDLISPEPKNDRSFRSSADLCNPEKAISNINADVAARTGLSRNYAYVSMYIVAVGTNPSMFSSIYSKPTHISVFKLPEN